MGYPAARLIAKAIQPYGGANFSAVGTCATLAAMQALALAGLATGYTLQMDGYYAGGDGGGGLFRLDLASAAAVNLGTVFATSGAGRWVRVYSGCVDARWFGCKIDGATNDTASLQGACDWVASLGGGEVFLPCAANRCLANILIVHRNVQLTGDSGTPEQAAGGLWAWSAATPTVQIGNDTGIVDNCYLVDLCISGDTIGGLHAPAGLRWGGGARHSGAINFAAYGGVITVHAEGGTAGPSNSATFAINHRGFHIRNDWADPTARAIKVRRAAPSFTTAIQFSCGHVSGPANAGYSAEADLETIYLSQVYFDIKPPAGLLSTNGGTFAGNQVTLDPGGVGPAPNIVLDIGADPLPHPARYLYGQFTIALGSVKYNSGATLDISPNGNFGALGLVYSAINAYVTQNIYFPTFAAPFDHSISIASPAAGKLRVTAAAGFDAPGTNTNDNPPGGYVGEMFTRLVTKAAASALATNTLLAIATVVGVVGGDYIVDGCINLDLAGATVTQIQASLNTSGVLDVDGSECNRWETLVAVTGQTSIVIPRKRISVLAASAPTVFLLVKVTFSAGTVKAYGAMNLIRQR